MPQQPDEIFEGNRPRLTKIAYRMLGSVSDGEDAVQDTWLRWHKQSHDDIENPDAFLTTTLVRLCLDRLRVTKRQRDAYTGPWLPEPIVTDPNSEDAMALADDVSIALLLTLERLSAKERAAFVLYDAFGYSHDEIALMLDQSPASCRKLVSRARQNIKKERPQYRSVEPDRAHALIKTFFKATQSGDVDGLIAMFKEDIVLLSDGGGKVWAALNPILGADSVARFLVGIARKTRPNLMMRNVLINGQPGALCSEGDKLILAVTADIGEDGVEVLYMMRNPDKLAHITILQA